MTTTLNVGELLNLVGLSTGVVLYTMLLAMVVRAARTPGLRSGFDALLLLTLSRPCVESVRVPAYRVAADGLPRPVSIHCGARVRRTRLLARCRCAFSPSRRASCGAWGGESHAGGGGIRRQRPRSRCALGGCRDRNCGSFIARYAAPDVYIRRPDRAVGGGHTRSSRRWTRVVGRRLATFAVSALHLSQLHRGEASWPVELVGHHASVPLAFAILYQDYRFALADLFLKRALSLLAIVAVAFAAIATFGVRSTAFAQFVQSDPRQMTILVTLWVATALCIRAPHGHNMVVDAVVLHRPDYPIIADNDCPTWRRTRTTSQTSALICLRTAHARAQRCLCGVARVDVFGTRHARRCGHRRQRGHRRRGFPRRRSSARATRNLRHRADHGSTSASWRSAN